MSHETFQRVKFRDRPVLQNFFAGPGAVSLNLPLETEFIMRPDKKTQCWEIISVNGRRVHVMMTFEAFIKFDGCYSILANSL